ncbi:MAG: hypothetical protein ABSG31_14395 [Tepidisphaeraceae bacterium]|jgi:Flp pilus assembly pilin Flp
MEHLRRFLSNKRGGAAVEYVPVLGLLTIVAAMVTALQGGNVLEAWWDLLKMIF